MKLSKKLRFLFSLTSLLVCLSMGSVFVNADVVLPDTVEETTTSAEDAQTYAGGKITLGDAKSMVEQMAVAVSQIATCSPEELEYAADVMAYQTDMYTNFASIVGEDSCGAYVSYDEVAVTETGDDTVDVTANLHFENTDLKMTLHVSCFDVLGTQITSTEFGLADEGEETFGSKMASAGSNTLMGMGTVFIVLIFISCIISLFKYIPKLTSMMENRKSGKKQGPVETPVVEAKKEVAVAETDNTELIAVIAAAIAASEHTSTDSFVVRSIRRR